MIIGISGPSASGKSTVAEAVRSAHGDALIVQQDWYFRSPSECPPDANFCELRWLHTDELVRDVRTLAQGDVAEVPVIDFATFERAGMARVLPRSLIIVEGMTIFRMQELVELFDRKFYVDIDMAVIAERKRERDKAERQKALEIVEGQLKWIAEEYANDSVIRDRADVIVLDGSSTPASMAHSVLHETGSRLDPISSEAGPG